MKVKTFQRGRSTYTCRVCTKQTRNTGDEGSADLCADCYDEAGVENEHLDGYHDEPHAHCPACQDSQCIKCGMETMHLRDSLCRKCAPERFATKGFRTTKQAAPAATTKEDITMSVSNALQNMTIKQLVELHNNHAPKSVKGFGTKGKAITAITKKCDEGELAIALGLAPAKLNGKAKRPTSGRRNVRATDSIRWVDVAAVKLAGPTEFKRLFGRRTAPFQVAEARDQFIEEAQMPRTGKDRNPMHWQQTLHRMRREGWIEILAVDEEMAM